MRTDLIMAGVAGAAAIMAGVAVLPRLEERAAILTNDGDPLGALAILEEADRSVGSDRQLAMQAIRVNEEAGRAAEALQGLSRYVARWPDDEAALVKLATVAKSTMQTKLRVQALEKLVALGADGTFGQELLSLYRDAGDVEAERQLLLSLGDDPQLIAEDFERLAGLLVATGDEEQALVAYRRADARAPLKEHECRFKLLVLLLQLGQFEEVAERATQWVSQWNEPYLAAEIAVQMARRAPANYVAAYAGSLTGSKRDLDLAIAEGLAKNGYRPLAYAVLNGSVDALGSGDKRRIRKIVEVAAEAQDPRVPLTLLSHLVSSPGREADAAFLAEHISESFGLDVLYPVYQWLGFNVLTARPLFGVDVALVGKNEDLARRILLSGTPHDLSVRDARRWAELMFTMLGAERALHRVAEIYQRGDLSAQMLLALEEESEHIGIPFKAVVGIKP